jgi:hypothetical protein
LVPFARRRPCGLPLVAALASAVALWLPATASADTLPAFTNAPVIQGAAVVGSTLQVAAAWTGDPIPTVTYTWAQCPASGTTCKAIAKATAAQYTVSAGDVGYRLAVSVALKNKAGTVTATAGPTAVVATPSAPAPKPPPPPPADPPASPPPLVPIAPAAVSPPSTNRPLPPTLLRPFPVVRIRGYFAPTGALVTLLSVRAPHSARISARCIGRGCPTSALSLPSAPARLHAFERFLPAGTLIQVRVARRGKIGKYTSFLIRAHNRPLRTDRCLMPGRSRPIRCPAS